jgi:hypothetical protein
MHQWVFSAAMFLALSLALGGCVVESWSGSQPEPTQVLEKAKEVSRGEAVLAELKALAFKLANQYRGAGGGTDGLCRFDVDGDDRLSDEEMLSIITAWVKGQLSNEELLTALTLWIRDASLGCLGYGGGFDRIAARDTAIEYIHSTDPQSGVPLGVDWLEEDITPAGLVGSAIFRYTWPAGTAGRAYRAWRIWVRYPIVPDPNYHVEVMNLATGNYWGFTVFSSGQVKLTPLNFEGTVIVHARDSRSESWGIVVTKVPPEFVEYQEYLGRHIGLKSWTVMKPDLERYEGKSIIVSLSKICLPFDEGCCQCVRGDESHEGFNFCAPFVELGPPLD